MSVLPIKKPSEGFNPSEGSQPCDFGAVALQLLIYLLSD